MLLPEAQGADPLEQTRQCFTWRNSEIEMGRGKRRSPLGPGSTEQKGTGQDTAGTPAAGSSRPLFPQGRGDAALTVTDSEFL